MARLEDVLPALREGKKIRRNVDAKDLAWAWVSSLNKEDILADDWEITPEPTRVADYLVLTPVFSGAGDFGAACYIKQTHPIGQQPEGSVMVPGSEREANE